MQGLLLNKQKTKRSWVCPILGKLLKSYPKEGLSITEGYLGLKVRYLFVEKHLADRHLVNTSSKVICCCDDGRHRLYHKALCRANVCRPNVCRPNCPSVKWFSTKRRGTVSIKVQLEQLSGFAKKSFKIWILILLGEDRWKFFFQATPLRGMDCATRKMIDLLPLQFSLGCFDLWLALRKKALQP
jgi:hypothetical protein